MLVYPVPRGWSVQAVLREGGAFEDVHILGVRPMPSHGISSDRTGRWIVCSPAYSPEDCAEVYTVPEEHVRMVRRG